MKNPDEIKKGLACCHVTKCGACPYMTEEIECREIFDDALDLIQQYERVIAYQEKNNGLLEDAVDKISGLIPKWISVEERLPEHEEDVLLLFETGIITGGFICGSDTWCAYSDGEYYTDCSNNPTHWMPLPEPPKEVCPWKLS